MTNVTPIFNEFLSTHPAVAVIPPDRKPPPPKDEFLKEAFRIESHISSLTKYLLSIRQAYLSTTSGRPNPSRVSTSSSASLLARNNQSTSLTDAQRDAIDAETKGVIQELLTVISRLESTEKVRVQTEEALLRKRYTSGLRGIFRDETEEREKEEDKLRILSVHREGVLWLLKTRLEKASELQRGQQEIRLQRQVERGKSILYKAPPGFLPPNHTSLPVASSSKSAAAASAGRSVWLEDEERKNIENILTEEQLQLFEKENGDLMKHYEDTLDQVRSAEKSLIEISSLQTQLATNLATQNAHIDNLVADSMSTVENVQRGNKELKKAGEKISIARSAFWGAVAFSGVVFIWDWFI
ncbi:hypothetical protein L873DRAFT_1785136 [Choiromyces venosus 120613-1]|uniref:t-SNARE coiled-coil homology domain-containing protein n=1 Tax=Choiromyces venosus 120613-1 TaxID=1336337 RepID=A0A3N4K640_9PEZI|nr:hypothetical protein L873DRAFT_1785136 [Choiromyces venosus 120613-1]